MGLFFPEQKTATVRHAGSKQALGICGYMSNPFLRILAISVHDFCWQICTQGDRVGQVFALSVSTYTDMRGLISGSSRAKTEG
jgi:hypothetical protein